MIEKCLGARQGTKQRATELLLLMVEVDTTAESVVVRYLLHVGLKGLDGVDNSVAKMKPVY